MSGILKMPLYAPCDVIDLGHKTFTTLPNRLYIKAVFLRRDDKCWMYQALNEATGEDRVFDEDFIKSRKSDKTAKVYNNKGIKARLAQGYRFCGNYADFIARDKGKTLAAMETIDSIILMPALDRYGRPIKDESGLWIKYATVINDDGTVVSKKNGEEIPPLVIK